MRRSLSLLAGGGLVAVLLAPISGTAASAAPEDTDDRSPVTSVADWARVAKSDGPVTKPAGPNPYLALLPDGKADYAGWQAYLADRAQAKADQRQRTVTQFERTQQVKSPIVVDEQEPEGSWGSNDTVQTAQLVAGFGTRKATNPRARILGTLSPEEVWYRPFEPSVEDDGSIPLAADTGLATARRKGIETSGRVGDGPHGRAGDGTGDFDFYAVHAKAGQQITVDVDTPAGRLDSWAVLWSADGEMLAYNDDFWNGDDEEDGLDPYLTYVTPEKGDYYVMVGGFFTMPADPFDSGSGDGVTSQGPYQLKLGVSASDLDFYGVRLRKGDVLGVSSDGGALDAKVYDPAGVEVIGSEQDATFIYPMQTPLPGGGNAVADHVAARNGMHYVAVTKGQGDYDITVEAYRPALEGTKPVQTLFLDFDGARVNTGIWGGFGVRDLSPLSAFLGRWGLTNDDYDAVVDTVVATVKENVKRDLVRSGLNDDFRVKVLNSRDHADPWGRPNVSRVIVGGTIEESGIDTIGIAQSIDPGNFGTEESALVLLDVLSEPRNSEFGDASLNFYLRPRSDRAGFVGTAVGNVTSHEAGHFFGNWHVDQFNDTANLMDQGGNFALMFGVGPDGIGGTADDVDVDFGEDTFNPNEGFTGTENTLARIVTVLTR